MANQTVSPYEAEIARKKLDELPPDIPQVNGTTFSITFDFASDPFDPGIGVFDFTKGTWTWYSKDEK